MTKINDYNINIGVITSVHGVKGNVKMRVFTHKIDDIEQFKNIFDEEDVAYKVKIVLKKKDKIIIASIEGIKSRNEAEKFVNKVLMIKRSELPEINENEFYYSDILGSVVKSTDGVIVGLVKNIVNFGASDIIEVLNHNDGCITTYPMIKKFINYLDISNKMIIVNNVEEEIAEH